MSDTAKVEVDDASGAWKEQDPKHEHKGEAGSSFIPVHAHSTSAKCRPRPDAFASDSMFASASTSASIPLSMPMHSPTPSLMFNTNDKEDMQA